MTETPVSVIVPHQKKRGWFFWNWVYPALLQANPREIIVMDGDEHPNIKRNKGAKKAKCDLLFFCDDDVIVSGCIFSHLNLTLHKNAYAYCDSYGFTLPGTKHYWAGTYTLLQNPWSIEDVEHRGTVTPMSLIRKDAFDKVGGFDPKLKNGHMRDLCKRFLKAGLRGVHHMAPLFLQFNIDNGITGKAMSR